MVLIRRSMLVSCAAVASLLATSPQLVRAQDNDLAEQKNETAAEPSEERAQPVNIEEITVTARKREESLQQTPVAITAFTETDLQDADIRNVQEITASVPSLQFDNATGNANSARIYLRGVGNGDPLSSDDPAVGLYVDGVFLPRAQGALVTLSDVQQIEVLRGPQGTLFGKNTIGGAISITSKKPDPSEFFGNAEIRVGNFSRFDTRLAVNVPLIPERAAARFSLATATRDPYTTNKGTGRDFDDDKFLGGRAQLLMIPTDDLEINISLDRSVERQAPGGGKCVVANRNPNFNAAVMNGTEPVGIDSNGDGIVNNQASAASFASVAGISLRNADGTPNGANIALQQQILGSLVTSQDQNRLLQACDTDDMRDERSVVSDLTSSKNNLSSSGVNGTITYNFGDGLTFKSISSWRRNDTTTRIDNDYTGINFAQSSRDAGDGQQDAWSQEFQLLGTGFDGRLNYVVGLFGFMEDIDDQAFAGLSTTNEFLGAGGFAIASDIVPGATSLGAAFAIDPVAAQAAFPTALNLGPGTVAGVNTVAIRGTAENQILKVDNKGYAGFAQGTYDVNDQFSITAGLRLTHERKRVKRQVIADQDGFSGPNAFRNGEMIFGFEGSTRFSDLSPMLNLSYQLNDETLIYTTFSKGFKSGGFNGRANLDNALLTNPIDDEKLTSYELGFKTSFLDNRVVLNGAVYWSIYDDIQLTIPRGIDGRAAVIVTNAADAEIKGGELEVRARLLPNLDLTGSLGVVNSRYTKFDDPNDARAKDRRVLATPNYTGNIAASYLLPLGDMGDLRMRTEWTHRGKSGTDVVDSEFLRKGKTGELDATVTWAMADGLTEVALFGSNLLNREFFVNGVSLGDSLGIGYRFYNVPRTYGVEIRRRF